MATTKRVTLVTGGMGGLGKAVCINNKERRYGRHNLLAGQHQAQAWLKSMQEQGYHFYAYACDVTDWIPVWLATVR